MGATAARSRRCQSPVYHYVISWHREERPNADIMRQVADTTCADLGLDGHQLLYIAHDDTDHRHVHIVANRVHPERFKDISQKRKDKEFQRDRRLGVEVAPAVWSKDRVDKERQQLAEVFAAAASWQEVEDALCFIIDLEAASRHVSSDAR